MQTSYTNKAGTKIVTIRAIKGFCFAALYDAGNEERIISAFGGPGVAIADALKWADTQLAN